jgi:hypothetical protein
LNQAGPWKRAIETGVAVRLPERVEVGKGRAVGVDLENGAQAGSNQGRRERSEVGRRAIEPAVAPLDEPSLRAPTVSAVERVQDRDVTRRIHLEYGANVVGSTGGGGAVKVPVRTLHQAGGWHQAIAVGGSEGM